VLLLVFAAFLIIHGVAQIKFQGGTETRKEDRRGKKNEDKLTISISSFHYCGEVLCHDL
jgi:hypothetical protein